MIIVLSCEMHLCMKNSMMLHKLSFLLVFEGSYNAPGYFPRVFVSFVSSLFYIFFDNCLFKETF